MKIVFRYYPHNAENVIIMIVTRIYQRNRRKDHYRPELHQTEIVYSGIFKKTKRREKKVGKTVRKIRTEKNKLHVWDFSRSIDECSAQKPSFFIPNAKRTIV